MISNKKLATSLDNLFVGASPEVVKKATANIPSTDKFFINLSGGVDSAFAFLQLAKNSQGRTIAILVHHCYYLKARRDHEMGATIHTINYVATNYPNCLIIYEQTTVPKKPVRWSTMDVILLSTPSALVLLRHKTMGDSTVLLPYCLEECVRINKMDGNVRLLPRGSRSRVFIEIMESISGLDLKFVVPYRLWTKRLCLSKLPTAIKNNMCFCRRPGTDGSPCGKCFNCKRVLPNL